MGLSTTKRTRFYLDLAISAYEDVGTLPLPDSTDGTCETILFIVG